MMSAGMVILLGALCEADGCGRSTCAAPLHKSHKHKCGMGVGVGALLPQSAACPTCPPAWLAAASTAGLPAKHTHALTASQHHNPPRLRVGSTP